MTDHHKTWLWRKKHSEKNTVAVEKEDQSLKMSDEQVHILLAEKAELERDLKDLNDKLSFALSECNENNELAKKHAKTAQEALAGWEKAEAKVISLKEELNEALDQRAAAEERITQLESALRECMQQLRFVREEKEHRIQDVLAKAAKDYEEKRLIFEEKLMESTRRAAVLEAEVAELDGIVHELNRYKSKADEDIKVLLTKLESSEKRNGSLMYEVRVLEKEIEIKNDEREFNRRTADAAHKQHLDNVRKIAKLESECQRLRVLVRKRLPGPAALAKMRSEVEVLERRSTTLGRDEKLRILEDENRVLRETLEKRSSELQMYSRSSSKISMAESQLEDRSKSPASMSDVGAPSEIDLMDDFVEMERLALVSVGDQTETGPVSSNEPGLSVSISKLVRMIEGFNSTSDDHDGYSVRRLRWKTAEFDAGIRSFLHICYDLMNGKAGLDQFAREVASMVEWIVERCSSPEDEARIERESDPPRSSLASTNGYHGAIPLLQIQSGLKEEIATLKAEMEKLESAKKYAEEKLEVMAVEGESLTSQLEIQKLENEDLDARVSAARVELEKKTKQCEELEAKCLELQIQLDSLTTKDVEEAADAKQQAKQLQTEWEITAASEKLAKCQETIFHLGKQLKALATPQEAAIFDDVVTSPTKPPPPIEKGAAARSSLLEKMLAEDDDGSPMTKEIICSSEPLKPPPGFQTAIRNPGFDSDLLRRSFRESAYGPLAIVTGKKPTSGGLFKRLLWRRKKKNSKLPLPFAA